jgi:hypothetical protein
LLPTAPVIDNRSNVLSRATLDIDGQPRDNNPDVGADEYVGGATVAAATLTATLAVEPSGEELPTLSQGALGVDNEPLATSEISAAAWVETRATPSDETDQLALIELLAEEIMGNSLPPDAQEDAESASLTDRLAEAMDALWEEFD